MLADESKVKKNVNSHEIKQSMCRPIKSIHNCYVFQNKQFSSQIITKNNELDEKVKRGGGGGGSALISRAPPRAARSTHAIK